MFMRFLLLLALLPAIPSSAFAQTNVEPPPMKMLAFLKPGMHVGIQSVEGTTDVLLSVDTDAEYELARDLTKRGSQSHDAESLASTHPIVRKRLDAYLAKLTQNSTESQPDSIQVLSLVRTSLGTISTVGDDFILVELDEDVQHRWILPQSAIGRIDLDATPLRFWDRQNRSSRP